MTYKSFGLKKRNAEHFVFFSYLCKMLCFPNAKLNLGLFVTEKRSDGFHNIETILIPIALCDALEITNIERKGVCDTPLHIHGLQIAGNPNDNLVFNAYKLLKNDFDLPNIHIDLLKKIPFGAGLGGGSSDATFMLKLLNQKFSLQISDEKLENYARQIGSDCAFFVKNKPVFAYEKGDKFEPINLDLSNYQIVLICPPIHVNTKTAYQNIVPKPVGAEHASPLLHLRNIADIPVSEWKNVLKNDFESFVFSQHPILSNIKQELYKAGAIYASMSGSGSAIFGLFNKCSEYRILQFSPLSSCKQSKVFTIDVANSSSSVSKS
jgi:4-diphosphocytidyl-2-C-methyl-D-erythritol kinase